MTRDYQAPFTPPPGSTEVLLVRHGAAVQITETTPLHPVHLQCDPPLAEQGHRQADRLRARLRDAPLARLFVSPLRRAAETLAPLAASHAEPIVLDELREVHLGDWEHQGGFQGSRPGMAEIREAMFRQESWGVIPGAEPAEAFGARVAAALARTADVAGPDRVAVAVTHGGVIAEACRQITQSRPFAFFATENGSITRVIRHADGRWSLISYNDTAHLRIDPPG